MESELKVILDTLKEQWPIAEIKLRFALFEREKLKAVVMWAKEHCCNKAQMETMDRMLANSMGESK